MYHFRMRGIMKDSDNQKVSEVLFKDGILTGDKILVEGIKRQAGYTMDGLEAMTVMVLMRKICNHAVIWGNYPVV